MTDFVSFTMPNNEPVWIAKANIESWRSETFWVEAAGINHKGTRITTLSGFHIVRETVEEVTTEMIA